MKHTSIAFSILLAFSPAGLFACDYCMLYQGSSPLEANGLSFRVDSRYLLLDRMYDNNVRVDNPFDERETYFTTQLSFVIPVVSEGSLLISVPLSSRASNMTMGNAPVTGNEPEMEPEAKAFGFGDATALVRYRVWHVMNQSYVFAAAVSAGVKFPTGRTSVHNVLGEFADAHIQPGSGSFDPLLGANLFAGTGLWGFSGSVFGWFPGEGARAYRFGPIANAEVNAVYHLFPETLVEQSLFVGLGLGGEWHATESLNGAAVENTGGKTFSVTPLLRLDLLRFSFETSLQLPIDHDLAGRQLGETYRGAIGIQYRP